MKPLIELSNDCKATFFDLQIYKIIEEIEKGCDKWMEGVFINVFVPEEIETRNLLMNLDYMFTQAIWLIELAESFKYELGSKQFIETKYNNYVEKGFKELINPHKYNIKEHRLCTEDEIKESNKRINEIAIRILKKMKL